MTAAMTAEEAFAKGRVVDAEKAAAHGRIESLANALMTVLVTHAQRGKLHLGEVMGALELAKLEVTRRSLEQ